ncbi:MAG TPA: type II secretion system protein N [Thermodesulfovibrionales bacterium]|nr:type II secretion system protein N [Thermodesulfovibrionales bacterium]
MLNILVSLSLFVLTLFFARDILSSFFKKTEKTVSQLPAGVPKLKKGLQEYAVILRSNPFGFPNGQLKELSAEKEGGASRSDLTLIGTVAGSPLQSYAIFADRSGTQEVFRVGESVFGAGKLKKVERDSALISENGREVKIPIADILTIREINPREAGTSASDFARSAGKGTFVVDQKKILNALENPNQLMTDARLQPNITDGKQEGFILREVRNGGLYQNLGLQNGDVLLRINDYNISNPENALQAFTALKGMDRVQVDLLRNGSRTTMTYQIR